MKPVDRDYSLAAACRSVLADTWTRYSSHERSVHHDLVERHGPCARVGSIRLPDHALRDMSVAGVSGSNYLVATESAGYLPSLQPRSVVLQLGATTVDAGRGHVVLDKASAAATVQWLSDENAAITESQPTFGQIAATPKILAVLVEVSHQMLKQSDAEQVLRAELARAAGAAIDKAALQGTGTLGQPLGILTTPSVGAFTGSSLNRTELTNAQLDVATANADLARRGYVTTPAVANLLANRADTIESTTALWRGNLHDGIVIGERALSTTNMPTDTAIYGAWPALNVISWGSLEIALDPMTKFNSGIVAIRLLAMVDIVAAHAAAFSAASSIT
jgi:HK97 family phage major capsid protein